GAHDLVVLPARAVDVLPVTRFLAGLSVAVGELTLLPVKEAQLVEQVAHLSSPHPGSGTQGLAGLPINGYDAPDHPAHGLLRFKRVGGRRVPYPRRTRSTHRQRPLPALSARAGTARS